MKYSKKMGMKKRIKKIIDTDADLKADKNRKFVEKRSKIHSPSFKGQLKNCRSNLFAFAKKARKQKKSSRSFFFWSLRSKVWIWKGKKYEKM